MLDINDNLGDGYKRKQPNKNTYETLKCWNRQSHPIVSL